MRIHRAFCGLSLGALLLSIFIRRTLSSFPGFYETPGTSVAISARAVFTALVLGVIAFYAAGLLPAFPSPWASVAAHGTAVACLFALYVALQMLFDRMAYATGLFPATVHRYEGAISGAAIRHAASGFEAGMLALASGYTLRRWPRAGAMELAQNAAREKLARLEVELLRAQLRPHFLFNALNSISALTRVDPSRARAMLAHLSRLLDRTAVSDRVPLTEELAVVRDYLEIERMRFGDNIAMEFVVSDEAVDSLVPSLLLQPLVENAVLHGARHGTQLRILVRAAVGHGNMLRIEVEDDGAGLLARSVHEGTGTGTANTISRLRLAYAERAQFSLEPRDGGGTRAIILLPRQLPRRHRRTRGS